MVGRESLLSGMHHPPRGVVCCYRRCVTHPGPAVHAGVSVEFFTPGAAVGEGDPVVFMGDSREVRDDDDLVTVVGGAGETHRVVVGVAIFEPPESFGGVIVVPQCAVPLVEGIEVAHQPADTCVGRVIE